MSFFSAKLHKPYSFYRFLFSLTIFPAENELTWDTSDWEAAWDSGENKEEELASAPTVGFCVSNLFLSSFYI